MKKNQERKKKHYRESMIKGLPILRGMFVCPEAIKNVINYTNDLIFTDGNGSDDKKSFATDISV